MAYTPINIGAFVAAYSGAISGMAVTGWVTDANAADYTTVVAIAGAYAQAFDLAWNNSVDLTWLEDKSITTLSEQVFQVRGPGPLANPVFQQASNWSVPAAAVVAIVTAGDSYFSGSVVPSGLTTLPNWVDATAIGGGVVGYPGTTPVDAKLSTKYNAVNLDNETNATQTINLLSQNAQPGAIVTFYNQGTAPIKVDGDAGEGVLLGYVNAGTSFNGVTYPGSASFVFVSALAGWDLMIPDSRVPILAKTITGATYFVNGTTGSNNNTGTAIGAPLQTWEAILALYGESPELNAGTVTINYTAAPQSTDYISWSPWLKTTGAKVILDFSSARTQAGTVNITANTQAVANTTPQLVTGAGLGAFVGKQAVITASTNPANIGAVGWILQSIDGNQCITSPFEKPDESGFAFGTIVTPLVGDTLTLFTLPTVKIADIFPRAKTEDTSAPTIFLIRNAALDGGTAGVASGTLQAYGAYLICSGCQLDFCRFAGFNVQLTACNINGCVCENGAFVNQDGGAMTGTFGSLVATAVWVCYNGVTVADTARFPTVQVGGILIVLNPLGMFIMNSTADTNFQVGTGGVLWALGNIFGTGNAGNDCRVFQSARLIYDSGKIPAVSGNGLINLGGRTAVEAFNQATQTYTAARNVSWANITTTVAGGGFGGAVLDPATGGQICLNA